MKTAADDIVRDVRDVREQDRVLTDIETGLDRLNTTNLEIAAQLSQHDRLLSEVDKGMDQTADTTHSANNAISVIRRRLASSSKHTACQILVVASLVACAVALAYFIFK